MLALTKLFGVTASSAERDLSAEQACVDAIVEKVLVMQKNAALQQNRSLGRGTHAKGVCARAKFEVFDVTVGNTPELASRLAKGIFAKPGDYPAVVRFGNADAKINSDFKPDVRSLSFSVDLTGDGTAASDWDVDRQDFSLQNTTTLPINDAPAFLAIMKLLTASNPAAGLLSLRFKDKLRVMRTLALVQVQSHQKIEPYQKLRYGSNVPFRHGPTEFVKYSATPVIGNPARSLQRSNPRGLQDELSRHLKEDGKMSAFDFGIQFLDTGKMTYWGNRHDPDFWIENASVEWKEADAPFHTVGRLTLLSNSQLPQDAGEAVYFDVTGHATADSAPVGSINRARGRGEVASRKARLGVGSN
jgi:catalase